MGEEGVRKLFAKDWPALKQINFGKLLIYAGNNKIGDGGMQVLLHRTLNLLQTLGLGREIVI